MKTCHCCCSFLQYADIDTGPVGQEGAKPWYEKTPIDKRRTTVLDAKKLRAAQLRDGEESDVSEDDDDDEGRLLRSV